MANAYQATAPAIEALNLIPGRRYLFVSKYYGAVVGTFHGTTRLGRLKFVDTAHLAVLDPDPARLYAQEIIEIEPWQQSVVPREYDQIVALDPETVPAKRLRIVKAGKAGGNG